MENLKNMGQRTPSCNTSCNKGYNKIPEYFRELFKYCSDTKELVWKTGKRSGLVAGTTYINRGKNIQRIIHRRPEGKSYSVSRIIWWLHYGEPPAGLMVSFRDGNSLNLDINNLTLSNQSDLNRVAYRKGRIRTTKDYIRSINALDHMWPWKK